MADRAANNYIMWVVSSDIGGGWLLRGSDGIDRYRSRLPIFAYFDCLQRASNIDWSKYGMGEDHPSASEICEKLKL